MDENSMYEIIIDAVGEAVIAVDAERKIVIWNKTAQALYGWEAHEVLGKPAETILETVFLDPDTTRSAAYEQIAQKGFWAGKVRQKCKDSSELIIESTVRPFKFDQSGKSGVVTINRDVSEREKLRNRINQLAYLNRVLLRLPSLDEVVRTNVAQIHEILPISRVVFIHPQPGIYDNNDANILLPATERVSLAINQILLMKTLQEHVRKNDILLLTSQENNRQLEEISKNLLRLQERERQNLAREFHDEIGQSLTTIFLNLRSILAECKDEHADVKMILTESIETVSRLMEQVRAISLDLHPKVLEDLGFIPALRWIINRTSKKLNGQVHFYPPPVYKSMDRESEFEVFRIVQEAITNILRHASAQNVWIHLSQDPKTTFLKIVDDGVGFDGRYESGAHLPPNSFGLSSMFARANLIGSKLIINSKPGKGTSVEIECPYDSENL